MILLLTFKAAILLGIYLKLRTLELPHEQDIGLSEEQRVQLENMLQYGLGGEDE